LSSPPPPEGGEPGSEPLPGVSELAEQIKALKGAHTIEATPQAERFIVTFNIDGRKARFEVTTSSVQNPFRLVDLEQFACPTKL
jgi:hypothetical protein